MSALTSSEDDQSYPPSNVLDDQCEEWRDTRGNPEFVVVLGCRQDIKSFYIKNGNSNYRTENFTVYVASHSKGPWKNVLEGSLDSTKPLVNEYIKK